MNKKEKHKREIMYSISMMSQLGISMMVPILVCVLLGNFIDQKVHTSPLFLIIFVVLGIGAAYKAVFDIMKRFLK